MTQEATIQLGQPWPEQLPANSDGTARHWAGMRSLLPLRILAVADVSPQHEQAIIDATDGGTDDLISLQAHQRLLGCPDWQGESAYLPVLMVGHYLRSPAGPIHRPLHWVITPTEDDLQAMSDLAGALGECLLVMGSGLEHHLEGSLVILGRSGRILSMQTFGLTFCGSMQWLNSLRVAATADGHHRLSAEDWEQSARQAAADLLPIAEQQQCIRALTHVAMLYGDGDSWDGDSWDGESCDVRGGQAQGWLVDNGWLHPKQIGGDL